MISSFAQIPFGTDFKTSSVSMDLKKSTDGELSSNDLIGKVAAQNKDSKVAMSKFIEQNKNLEGELERLNGEMSSNSNKFMNQENELQKQIMMLEEELSKSYEEKEENRIRADGIINELNMKLDEQDAINKDLMIQVEELNFTINSLKLDHEANSEHFSLKSNQYRGKINELDERIDYLTKELEKEEIKSHGLDEKLNLKSNDFDRQKEELARKEKEADELMGEKGQLLVLIEELKRSKKELIEKVSEFEFKLNTEFEINQKTKILLEDEESKGTELKNFINDLMKQKEQAIKNELEKSESIIVLEGSIVELTREKEMLSEECARNKATIDEQKDQIKKLNQNIKEGEAELQEEKVKAGRQNEKLREKEKELNLKEEEHERLQNEHNQYTEKMQKESHDLQS